MRAAPSLLVGATRGGDECKELFYLAVLKDIDNGESP
jgi:hypothetical protein